MKQLRAIKQYDSALNYNNDGKQCNRHDFR